MRVWIGAPLVVALLSFGPPRFNVKMAIDASRAAPHVHALAIDALQHGMYDDSTIVAAPPPTRGEIGAANATQTVLVRGGLSVKDDSATVTSFFFAR